MTRSCPTGLVSVRHKPAILEFCCYSVGVDVLVQSNALQCHNPLDKSSGKIPSPIRPRRDWVEESARFRLPAAPLPGGRPLVEDSVGGSCANQRLRAAPRQGRTSDPTALLL